MKIPLFDLDNTLTVGGSKNGIHRQAYDYALHTIYHLPDASFSEIVIDGMLDSQILLEVAIKHGYSEEEALEKLPHAVQAMVDYFFKHKDEHPVTPHKGAKELLEKLQPQVPCGILSGNIKAICLEKLQQAGLREYISFGAYGDMALRRVALIPIAQHIYEEQFKEKRPVTDFVIIGDTPRDIACAREGGIQVIAVATGHYTKEELKEADLVVETLEEQQEILNFLS